MGVQNDAPLIFSKLNKNLETEEQEQYVFIDDQELIDAMYNYRRGQILEDESKVLKENAKEVFKRKLCSKNIRYAYTKDFNLILTNYISNRFNTEKFKVDHKELYDKYLKQIPSLRVTLDNYQN